eukprot:6201161-Pleurochrysis_carterae.AAC.6
MSRTRPRASYNQLASTDTCCEKKQQLYAPCVTINTSVYGNPAITEIKFDGCRQRCTRTNNYSPLASRVHCQLLDIKQMHPHLKRTACAGSHHPRKSLGMQTRLERQSLARAAA